MRTDLTDYLIPREAAFYFCVSVANNILVNYQKTINNVSEKLSTTLLEHLSLAYVNNCFGNLNLPFKGINNVEIIGKATLIESLRAHFDLNLVKSLAANESNFPPKTPNL